MRFEFEVLDKEHFFKRIIQLVRTHQMGWGTFPYKMGTRERGWGITTFIFRVRTEWRNPCALLMKTRLN